MAQTHIRARVLGDYIVTHQIGSGSFSVVWHGRHRVFGTEVAVKEIIMEKLNKKLQDSLLSEVVILKKINHPNIIRLHDIIEKPGRIFLILDYCKGGDLSLYIQQRGSISEETAKYFMQQLASGLKVLRENNIIHRDLKPQNLLLLTNDCHPILKIADFGFARSLQPLGLAETLCGSPLYMAPEIMQLQKYDAKADLWSVGAILFQLVTGRTPFTGNNQIQLLQNIMKSNELQYPLDKKSLSSDCMDLCQKLLRRNPVERLTFEEFFNHQFLSQTSMNELLRIHRSIACSSTISASIVSAKNTDNFPQDECLPFILDDDSNILDRGQPYPKTTHVTSACGISVSRKNVSADGGTQVASGFNAAKSVNMDEIKQPFCELPLSSTSKGAINESLRVADSLESIVREYVFVSGPLLEGSSSNSYIPFHSSKSESLLAASKSNTGLSTPIPVGSAAANDNCGIGSVGSNSSIPFGTSPKSVDAGDVSEQSSKNMMTRIKLLRQCASIVADLVKEQAESGRQFEALSIQLVNLGVWKQILTICEAYKASVGAEMLHQEATSRENVYRPLTADRQELFLSDNSGVATICLESEREFLSEVSRAEELAEDLGPAIGNLEMPDAIETIFQSALSLGRHGAVDELMGDMEHALDFYDKAVCLLTFLLVEAPSLDVNPPFALTSSDRFRLQSYIDILKNRHDFSMSQKMAFLEDYDQQGSCP